LTGRNFSEYLQQAAMGQFVQHEHETSFLVQINYCDWFAWCMVTAVALLLLLYVQHIWC